MRWILAIFFGIPMLVFNAIGWNSAANYCWGLMNGLDEPFITRIHFIDGTLFFINRFSLGRKRQRRKILDKYIKLARQQHPEAKIRRFSYLFGGYCVPIELDREIYEGIQHDDEHPQAISNLMYI